MPNHKSAEKRVRQSVTRRTRTMIQKSKSRNRVKAVRDAIEAGNHEEASALLPAAVSQLYRAASKGAIPKTRANRTVARLSKAVNGSQS
jgi:small subunit ribosomal protein S20